MITLLNGSQLSATDKLEIASVDDYTSQCVSCMHRGHKKNASYLSSYNNNFYIHAICIVGPIYASLLSSRPTAKIDKYGCIVTGVTHVHGQLR